MRRLSNWWLALAIAASPAWGGSVEYTSASAWTASSPGNLNVVDFESTSPAYFPSSLTLSPFTFSASGGLYVLNGAAAGTGSGHFLTTVGSSVLTVSLASAIYGVAFNLGDNFTPSETATIVAVDANGVQYTTSSFATSGAANPAAFWGLRNDVQLMSVVITFTGGIQPQIDNVRYANTALTSGSQTPETESSILVFGGLVLIAVRALLRDAQDHRREAHE